MKDEKEKEAERTAREREATSDETLHDGEKKSATTDAGNTTDNASNALATPDGQFDGDPSTSHDADPM